MRNAIKNKNCNGNIYQVSIFQAWNKTLHAHSCLILIAVIFSKAWSLLLEEDDPRRHSATCPRSHSQQWLKGVGKASDEEVEIGVRSNHVFHPHHTSGSGTKLLSDKSFSLKHLNHYPDTCWKLFLLFKSVLQMKSFTCSQSSSDAVTVDAYESEVFNTEYLLFPFYAWCLKERLQWCSGNVNDQINVPVRMSGRHYFRALWLSGERICESKGGSQCGWKAWAITPTLHCYLCTSLLSLHVLYNILITTRKSWVCQKSRPTQQGCPQSWAITARAMY